MTGRVVPSVRRANPPDFDQLEPDQFEELGCAILDKEPGVRVADLFHTRFDAQYGIDAFGETDYGLVVLSCKRCKQIRKGDMAQWSGDFLDHWETCWKEQRVTRFVLAVTAPTNSRASSWLCCSR